jgi:predicted nuclease of predicted toxin-antitoxin system
LSRISLYFDEDAMHNRLVDALRSRGVTVVTVLDAGLTEKTDEEQLGFATESGCVLYTFNVPDFHRLHGKWIAVGREHAGMILAPQQRFSVGQQLRLILRLRANVTAAAMRNRVEFLSNWG